MTTLAEHMIVVGTENRPLMFDKKMYKSWQIRMLLNNKGKKNGRMMLESIENGLLIYPTTKENGQIRNEKTSFDPRNEATIQDDRVIVQQVQGRQGQSFADPRIPDGQAIQTTILQNSSFQTNDLDAYDFECDDISSTKSVLMANLSSYGSDVLFEVPQHDSYQNIDMINQSVQETQNFEQSLIDYVLDNEITSLAILVFLPRDGPIACLNKAMAFTLIVVASCFPSTNNQLRTSFDPRNEATIQDDRLVKQGLLSVITVKESGQVLDEEQLAFLADPRIPDGQAIQTTILQNSSFQTNDLDAYDFECDDISSTKSVLMANLSSYGLDVLFEHSWEHADTLREIVEHARALKPLDRDLNSACMYVQRIQDVLVYVTDTCPGLTKPSEKLVVVTLLNKKQKARFIEPATSSSNIQKQVVQIILWYLDSGYSKHMTGNRSQLINFVHKLLEVVAIACLTQNQSLIRKCHNKTPYELLHNKKSDLSYLRIFGALCYPTNDNEDLG
nr:integrase, catalytic region, zinc finger, CCHC-type, peptidase aspartic, catalytic [Tanacetum cinerariifolium]